MWGGIDLILKWRKHRSEVREKKDKELERKVYEYLLTSGESHTAGGVWAEVVVRPLLEGVKLKYSIEYDYNPGWKIKLGRFYWTVRVWFRKLGAPSENAVYSRMAEMHRRGELVMGRDGFFRAPSNVRV
jgi:hypothetical protein